MSSHAKMTAYRGTFSLAYNNGNLYPFHLFKGPSARDSWRAGECVRTRGIWWKIRHLRGSPEKPAIRKPAALMQDKNSTPCLLIPWVFITMSVCHLQMFLKPRLLFPAFPAMAWFQISPSDEFYTFDSFRADSLFGSFWAWKFSVLVNIFQMLMHLLWVQDCANV